MIIFMCAGTPARKIERRIKMKKPHITYAQDERRALQRSIRRLTSNATEKELRLIQSFAQGIIG